MQGEPSAGRRRLKRVMWTREEDYALRSAVEIHGARNWLRIAEEVGTRYDWQCRERWRNHLAHDVSKGEWSKNEDDRLLRAVNSEGRHWNVLALEFPGRTGSALKNRFNTLARRRARREEMLSVQACLCAPGSHDTTTSTHPAPRVYPVSRGVDTSMSLAQHAPGDVIGSTENQAHTLAFSPPFITQPAESAQMLVGRGDCSTGMPTATGLTLDSMLPHEGRPLAQWTGGLASCDCCNAFVARVAGHSVLSSQHPEAPDQTFGYRLDRASRDEQIVMRSCARSMHATIPQPSSEVLPGCWYHRAPGLLGSLPSSLQDSHLIAQWPSHPQHCVSSSLDANDQYITMPHGGRAAMGPFANGPAADEAINLMAHLLGRGEVIPDRMPRELALDQTQLITGDTYPPEGPVVHHEEHWWVQNLQLLPPRPAQLAGGSAHNPAPSALNPTTHQSN